MSSKHRELTEGGEQDPRRRPRRRRRRRRPRLRGPWRKHGRGPGRRRPRLTRPPTEPAHLSSPLFERANVELLGRDLFFLFLYFRRRFLERARQAAEQALICREGRVHGPPIGRRAGDEERGEGVRERQSKREREREDAKKLVALDFSTPPPPPTAPTPARSSHIDEIKCV